MEDDPRLDTMRQEIQRLKWRISTLENTELECVKAVSALHTSEERYRRLMAEAGFPITISSTGDSTILYANPLACSLFGLEGPHPEGRRMTEFYADPAARGDLIALLRPLGVVRDWESVVVDGRGRSRVLMITASLIVYEGVEAILATSNDITERRYSEALFRTLVETSPDGFAIAAPDRRLTYVSAQTLRFFGHGAPEAMLGRDIASFLPGEEHPRLAARLQGILRGEYQGPSEWTGLRKDGTTFPQEINGEVLRSPDGSPHAFFFIIRDLSNRKRVERSLRWAEKLESLGLMAAGIAHELNNAFQVTQGHLEEARLEGDLAPDLVRLLDRVGGGVDRASALAREMLDYSGRTLRTDTQLHLDQIAEEGLSWWRECLPANASLVLDRGRDLPPLAGDEGQIRKVLSAFVLNAVEALEGREGRIAVATGLRVLAKPALDEGFWPAAGREGTYLCMEVEDSGQGMPPDRLERVCDPFFTTRGQGRGLGLSAALGILRAHHACLQILSRPGQGTTVRAYFPVAPAAPQVPQERPNAPARAGILVVEDDDGFRELLVRMLPRWGFEPVLEAWDGLQALEVFQANQEAIGIVLTDATMPRLGGPEAFEAMRSTAPSVLGVLMTGYSTAFGKTTAAGFGFAAFLNKPFTFKDLKAKLDEVRSGR